MIVSSGLPLETDQRETNDEIRRDCGYAAVAST
jgi:hypothetical protein